MSQEKMSNSYIDEDDNFIYIHSTQSTPNRVRYRRDSEVMKFFEEPINEPNKESDSSKP